VLNLLSTPNDALVVVDVVVEKGHYAVVYGAMTPLLLAILPLLATALLSILAQ